MRCAKTLVFGFLFSLLLLTAGSAPPLWAQAAPPPPAPAVVPQNTGAPLAVQPPPAAAPLLRLVVLDIHPLDKTEQGAKSLTPVVVQELARTGMFTIVSKEELARLLEHAADRQLLGCTVEAECLVEMGNVLNADKLIAGSLGRLGNTYVLTLQMLDVKGKRVDKRVERSIKDTADALLPEAQSATRQLVGELLAERAGSLAILSTQSGADVFLDDVLVGTTPLPPFALAGGWHRLRLQKRGYVPFARDLRITPHEKTELPVSLQASAEFIRAYRARNQTYRALAWTFSALGVASLGSAIGLEVWNDKRYRNDYQPRRRRYLADPQGAGDGERDSLNSLGRSIDRLGYTWAGLYAVAGLSTGLALYFFLDGDDPNRYPAPSDPPKEPALVGTDIGVAPMGGGAILSATLRY